MAFKDIQRDVWVCRVFRDRFAININNFGLLLFKDVNCAICFGNISRGITNTVVNNVCSGLILIHFSGDGNATAQVPIFIITGDCTRILKPFSLSISNSQKRNSSVTIQVYFREYSIDRYILQLTCNCFGRISILSLYNAIKGYDRDVAG